MEAPQSLDVRVHSINASADGILLFDLRPVGAPLPPFDAGAHVDLHLPNGIVRSYSRLNDPAECHRCVLGIHRCGPVPMLDAFQQACEGLPEERVHFEYFAPKEETAIAHGGFSVVLASSNKRILVAKDQTILDALRAEGVTVPSSCEQGICGACETSVLEGVPDHRDLVLSPKERASNKVMMICCSGAKSPSLVLDA
ncbi:hypothetical protein BH11PSE9_BH11PSE9_16970 [soil metagenome]